MSICDELIVLNRRRRFCIDTRIRLMNSVLAYARLLLGFRGDADDESRAAIREKAAALVKAIIKNDSLEAFDAAVVEEVRDLYTQTAPALENLAAREKALAKTMERLVKELPVWDWVESIRGFGAIGLATIIGECGDLSNYSTPAKLWKRLGLAPSECYNMTTKTGETACAKPKRRRSVMFNVGDPLIKQGLEYRQLYLDRKEYETPRVKTKMHAHRRAQRYMEKRLLRDLWNAWNGKTAPVVV